MSIFELIINFTLIVVCFVMGVFFLFFINYKHINNKNYKTSLKIIAISYLIMGVLNSLNLFFDLANYEPEIFPFLIILISSLQAILFTYSLVLLLNPLKVTRKLLIKNLIPEMIFVFAYIFSFFIFNDVLITNLKVLKENISNPTVIIRMLFFMFYVSQLFYFTILFIKNVNIYKKSIDDFFSDTENLQLIWVRIAFFSALSIGFIVLIFQIFPNKVYNLIISTIVMVYYFLFAVNYLNYNKLYLTIEPVFEKVKPENIQKIDTYQTKTKWENLKSTIIEKKIYLQEGITLEEISKNLFIARTTLSNLINTEEGVNFNTWINNLRIEEAKNFFLHNPDYTIFQVSQLTGFSEQSNFSRQFKQITGLTPSNWRKEHLYNHL